MFFFQACSIIRLLNGTVCDGLRGSSVLCGTNILSYLYLLTEVHLLFTLHVLILALLQMGVVPLGLQAREELHGEVYDIRGLLHQVVDSEVQERLLELWRDGVVALLTHLPRAGLACLVCLRLVTNEDLIISHLSQNFDNRNVSIYLLYFDDVKILLKNYMHFHPPAH